MSYSNEVTIELKIDRFNLDQKAYFQGAIDRMQYNGIKTSVCSAGGHLLCGVGNEGHVGIEILKCGLSIF